MWQVFEGSGVVTVGDERYEVGTGDLFAVPSWAGLAFDDRTDGGLDAFRFCDEPVFEALGLARTAARSAREARHHPHRHRHRAVRVDEDGAVELGSRDLGALLARPDWKAAAAERPTGAATTLAGSTTPRSSRARRRSSASG